MRLLCKVLTGIVTFCWHMDISHGFGSEPIILRDPNDMLSYGNSETHVERKESLTKAPSVDNCASYTNSVNAAKEKVATCYIRVRNLEEQLESSRTHLLTRCVEAGEIDFRAYYARIIQHISNLFSPEERSIEIDSVKVVRFEVKLNPSSWQALHKSSPDEDTLMKLDNFFEYDWTKIPLVERETFREYISSLRLDPLQMSIYVLGVTFIVVCFWILLSMINDTLRFRKFHQMILIGLVLVFLSSCLWQWRLMIKKLEASRMASSLPHEREKIAKQCMGDGEQSFLQWSKTSMQSLGRILTGGVDPCKQYFNDVAIDPEDEITPLMVLSETCASFIVQPLSTIGLHLGLFLTQFFTNVPVLYMLPAIVFIMMFFIIGLLVVFGYSFHFPFWMGGVQANVRSQPKPDYIEKHIELEQKEREIEPLLEGAKLALNSICEVAIIRAKQDNASSAQQMITASSDLIYQKLEKAIHEKFSCVSSQVVLRQSRPVTPEHRSLSRRGSCIRNSEYKDKVDGKVQNDDVFMNQVKEILEVD